MLIYLPFSDKGITMEVSEELIKLLSSEFRTVETHPLQPLTHMDQCMSDSFYLTNQVN